MLSTFQIAQSGGGPAEMPEGRRTTAPGSCHTDCHLPQSSNRVATARPHPSRARLGPARPSRPRQYPSQSSGIRVMDRESPGAMTILFLAPTKTEYTGANTPCRAAASAPGSCHSRKGGPVGWGSTAYVAGSISGGWSSAHPPRGGCGRGGRPGTPAPSAPCRIPQTRARPNKLPLAPAPGDWASPAAENPPRLGTTRRALLSDYLGALIVPPETGHSPDAVPEP